MIEITQEAVAEWRRGLEAKHDFEEGLMGTVAAGRGRWPTVVVGVVANDPIEPSLVLRVQRFGEDKDVDIVLPARDAERLGQMILDGAKVMWSEWMAHERREKAKLDAANDASYAASAASEGDETDE